MGLNPVETVLLENIDKPGTLFVFPTDVAVSRWADQLLKLRGDGTIPMEKFTAWDTFKQNSIKAKVQNRKSIPAVLRKMFVTVLIRENAELCAGGGQPIFSSLIRSEWAGQADSFAGWITGILPQLGSWFAKAVGMPVDRIKGGVIEGKDGEAALRIAEHFTGDDRDLFSLTRCYAEFLEKHGLFEPAWETPPFDDTGKECFIFFPEALFDFDEYRELLESSGHVKTVPAGTEQSPCDVFFYTNSRNEITEAALYISALHNNQNIPWDSVAVSIPDAAAGGDAGYGPYLFREFTNRNIPFVKLSGKPLASYPAGQFFTALADCVSDDFSFASLTALVLNRHLPWKDGPDIQALVEFGIRNNCVSSWTEEEDGEEKKVNIWEDSFAGPLGGFNPAMRRFFEDLRRRANALRSADSFANLRKQYFIFRERFFDMENCLDESDLILSRCITELMYLAEIEKSYPDVKVGDPYSFFTGYLAEVEYLARQAASGVAVLPYRTSAPAPFDCHIVLGANQDNLSMIFTPLKFLPKSKREKLGMEDNDVSLAYINLHCFNSRLPAAFFCSQQTFSGYAVPHNALNAALKPGQRFGDDAEFGEKFPADLFRIEDELYMGLYFPEQAGRIPDIKELHKNQKQGFEKWRDRRKRPSVATGTLSGGGSLAAEHPLLKLIRRRFCYDNVRYSVSPSSLETYFQCPLKWVFERALVLENAELETELVSYIVRGQVFHAVLNLFLDELMVTGETIAVPVVLGDDKKPLPSLSEYYRKILSQKTDVVFESLPRLPQNERQVMSMLTARLLRAEKHLYFSHLEKFLAVFISWFAGCRVIATEKKYTLQKDFYYLNGRVDCILEDIRDSSPAKGTAIIVDFKARTLPALEDCTGEGEGLADFQLPMYLRLAESSLGKDVHTALFFSVIDAEPMVLFGEIQNILDGSSVPKNKDDCIIRGSDSFISIMNEFDKKAEQYAREISEGAFSLFPSGPEKCLECVYNRICRTLYHICRGTHNGT